MMACYGSGCGCHHWDHSSTLYCTTIVVMISVVIALVLVHVNVQEPCRAKYLAMYISIRLYSRDATK